LTADAVWAMLFQLALDGKVASLPGDRNQRIARHDDD
jgi:hypothetical protein